MKIRYGVFAVVISVLLLIALTMNLVSATPAVKGTTTALYEGWRVRIDVTSSAGADVAEFGLNGTATDGFDPGFDIPEPPAPPPPYLQAYFYYPGNPLVKKLSTSYIPAHENGNSWPLQLDYSGDASDVTITWNADDIVAVPANYSLRFINDGGDINMRITPSYTFSATTGTYGFEIRANATSPCFIATAAYGTPLHDDIDVLRAFRDEYLMANSPGRAFVKAYYTLSPPIAAMIRDNEWLGIAVRTGFVKPAVYVTSMFVG